MYTRLPLIISLILCLAAGAQAVVYVKHDSPGLSFDGDSWETAYRTIQQAVTDAEVLKEDVWVARGAYAENITVTRVIGIYGGFAGTETDLAQRDWTANPTVVDPGGSGNVFTLTAGARIDGFTITNGEYGTFSESCGPVITNNTISNCKAFGVYFHSGKPNISGNTFAGNAFGVGCESGQATISRNVFAGNSEYAVYSLSGSHTVSGNTMQSSYGGIYASSGTLNAEGNSIRANAACGIYSCEGVSAAVGSNILAGNDEGIRTDAVNASIANNTVASSARYGIFWHDGAPSIANNIVAYNSTGLAKFGGAEVLSRNNVYQNGTNYGASVSASNNISADPLFANAAAGDYHLTPGSPCVNGGIISASGPTFDIDGEGRVYGGIVDIGADEYWSTVFSPLDIKGAPEGAVIRADGGIVSAAFTGSLYLENEDRASGIRVVKADHGMSENVRANIAGKVMTDENGERYIAADSVTTDGSTGDIRPLAIANKAIGGAAVGWQAGVSSWQWTTDSGDAPRYAWMPSQHMNNIGLLITTWGRVTTIGDGYLYIDDGSGLDDGTLTGAEKNTGVRVICDPAEYASGDYLVVTGISSCFKATSGLARRILPRSPEDIRGVEE